MNHLKKGAKIALLGENYFPPMNNSHVSKTRAKALEKIMNVILHYEPSVIYVCPTRGVNINLLPALLLHNIRVKLVFPSKHFFATLNEDEKLILEIATGKADKVIILSDAKSDPLRWAEDWYEATKKVVDNSDWVLIAHDRIALNEAFNDLVLRFDNNTKPVLSVGFGEEG